MSSPSSSGEFELLFSGDLIALGPVGGLIARRWFAGDSLGEIQRGVEASFGRVVSESDLHAFVEQLLPLSEGRAAARERSDAFAVAVKGGSLDLGRSTAIEPRLKWIERRLSEERAQDLPRTRLIGVLSPHGALERTDPCSFRAWSRLRSEDWPDVFVVLGSSHYDARASLLTYDVTTRHGTIRTARDIAEKLRARMRPRPALNSPAFLIEHSWQVDLPIIQALGKKFHRPVNVIAMLVGRMTHEEGAAFGKLLSKTLLETNRRGVLIASGDLSHFGDGYRWTPEWMRKKRTVGDVVDTLQKFERPALRGIAERDQARFDAVALASSFCARAQVNALTSFATKATEGVILDHGSLVNWTRAVNRRRKWRAEDKIFDVSSVAFHLASATSTKGAGQAGICRRVLIDTSSDQVRLFHPCDNQTYELPLDTIELVLGLLDGLLDAKLLAARVSKKVGRAISSETVRGFEDQLMQLGLLHDEEKPSVMLSKFSLARASSMIAFARENVDGYATLTSNELVDAPFLSSTAVAQQPRAYMNRAIAHRSLDSLARDFEIRFSSGTTGTKRLSLVEKAIDIERAEAEIILGVIGNRVARVNRPGNLFDRKVRPQLTKHGISSNEAPGLLRMSPGKDPIRATSAQWRTIADRLIEFEPVVLEGDPLFVGALAQHCLVSQITFPTLRRVELGHSYPWQRQLDFIRDAFRVPIHRRYHASEAYTLAADCPEGNMHLLETHALCEMLTGGRQAKKNELAAVVVTTLDSGARPLIRYVLGDVARVTDSSCRCGRPFRIIEVEGRLRFLFRDSSKRIVTQRMMDKAIGSPEGVSFFQFMIPGEGPIVLTLVPHTKAKVDAARIRKTVSDALRVPVEVKFAHALPVTEKVVTIDRTPDFSPRFVDVQHFLGRKN